MELVECVTGGPGHSKSRLYNFKVGGYQHEPEQTCGGDFLCKDMIVVLDVWMQRLGISKNRHMMSK